jgi:hypothetical protein
MLSSAFTSDNTAGASPEVLAAVASAANGPAAPMVTTSSPTAPASS